MVYLTNRSKRGATSTTFANFLPARKGIAHVYGAEDFSQLGLPTRAMSDQWPTLCSGRLLIMRSAMIGRQLFNRKSP